MPPGGLSTSLLATSFDWSWNAWRFAKVEVMGLQGEGWEESKVWLKTPTISAFLTGVLLAGLLFKSFFQIMIFKLQHWIYDLFWRKVTNTYQWMGWLIHNLTIFLFVFFDSRGVLYQPWAGEIWRGDSDELIPWVSQLQWKTNSWHLKMRCSFFSRNLLFSRGL